MLDLPDLPGAACAGHPDPEIWTAEDYARIEEARPICATCPAFDACLEWALVHDEPNVWAGMSRAERHAYARRERYGIVTLPAPLAIHVQAKCSA